MNFLYPSFLWALLALLIPIIIHLFYFRRFKKVYFTNVKYLKEIKEETSSRNKLKNFLTLLMRLLALAFLIFAFAQPYIPQGDNIKKGTKGISLFVDNSFSMNALSKDVPLITKAKDKARAIIEAYSPEDKFQILTNDFEGRHQRMVDKDVAISMLEEIEISPSVKSLNQVINRQKQTLNSQLIDHEIIYLLSDFQESITQIEGITDTLAEYNLIPLQSVQEKNVSIDSCWFEAPVPMLNQANKVYAKLTNYSDEAAQNIRLSLIENGQSRPLGSFDIEANSSIVQDFNLSILKTGWQEMQIEISDYPVQFDDKYLFAYNIDEKINILILNSSASSKYLNAAFNGLDYFQVNNQNTNRVDYAQFKNFDLIILNDLNTYSSGLTAELKQYTDGGGNLLIFPGSSLDITAANYLTNQLGINNFQEKSTTPKTVGSINTDEFIFNNVFERTDQNVKLPTASTSYSLTNFQRSGQQKLLSFRDGSSYLGKYTKGDGNVYLCASPINTEMNDLVRNAEIFIPMLYKMSLSSGRKQQIAYTIGKDDLIEVEASDVGSEILYKISGAEEFIPGQVSSGNKKLLDLNDNITEAGFYDLKLEDKKLGAYAFNFNRKESNLNCYNVEELESRFGETMNVIDQRDETSLASFVSSKDSGTVMWRWCIILVLIFLGIEALLLRFWQR